MLALCFIIVLVRFIIAVHVYRTDLFEETVYPNPIMKIVPKDFQSLADAVGTCSPLLLFIRSAEATHDIHHVTKHCQHRMKAYLDQDCISDLEPSQRLAYFDPDLTEAGLKQADSLQTILEASGWIELIESIEPVQYLSSPLSRSIQTALRVMPNARFTVDDGLRERITPLGPHLRRSFSTSMTIEGKPVESIQDKFIDDAARLIWQMAKPDSDNIYDRFGFYSDRDPNIEIEHHETPEQLDHRIVEWLNMLRPTRGTSNDQLPKMYVIFADYELISGVIRHFDLAEYHDQHYQPNNHCEVVPIMITWNTSTA